MTSRLIHGRTPNRRPDVRDCGSSDALGLALIAPAAIGLALVIVFLGRGVDSRATVQSAAESAAQAAAQERTIVGARTAAEQVGAAMLVDPASCAAPRVVVDTSDFRPGGQVAVTVSCTVSTDGLEPINPPTPGPTSATAFATIDPLRAAEGGP
jgi:Flp pilus assembly protein TadG